jgi:3-hydroxyisobutyrate dehydrogenase-like beta-hydroxyacid dehydrogenase
LNSAADAWRAMMLHSGSAAPAASTARRVVRAFPDAIFVKDLGIVLEAGRGAKAALPLAALAHQMFLAVSGQGGGADDDSQVIRAYRALNPG